MAVVFFMQIGIFMVPYASYAFVLNYTDDKSNIGKGLKKIWMD